ncbi:RagB/SusD family nutrient uptake outer membrane protein [Flavobacterium sp.]|uniref:RagB/SusD family nutrient uptake outer membrane protein n=1 Tax=Flavobacterium sp. TaxID=239 RepID=UPI00375255A1
MKKYIAINKVLLVCISVILFSACSDFLDTKPITSEISPPQDEQVLKNAQDAENAIKACYQIFGSEYWQFDYFFLGDAGSDVAYAGGDGEDFFQIDEYRIISTDYVVARDWSHVNDFVKLCNKVINYVNTVPDLSQQRKDEMMGEASLYRALFRFQGVQTWGEFPIVTEYISSINQDNFETIYPSLYPGRKPVTEVYAAIIADCEVALAKAPAATSAPSSKYKPNKGAANALLAKVYATMPNPDWAKVIQYSNAVIAGGYSLLPTYDFLFDNKHEGNAEAIWEINGEGNGSLINGWCTNVFVGTNWKKFNTPSHTISNALAADSKRRLATIKRFPTTFADPYWTSYTQFPNPWKMRAADATQNFYIFRLADILLLKAEALANTGDLTGAMALVNQVRTRVSLTNVAPATSKDDAINKILNERFVELAFEGQRWFDLKREGKSIEVLSKQTYSKFNPVTQVFDVVLMPYANNITTNDLLWPIPQAVLDNNPNLSQNPGY